MKLATIRSDLRRGLSPEQIARLRAGELGLSHSTIYRWVAAGYGEMTNMELRRKVDYRPRRGPRRAAGRGAPLLLRPHAEPAEGRLRAQPRRGQEAAPQGARRPLRPAHARRLRAAFGDDADGLLDAFGIEGLGTDELDLTPGCIDWAREERGEAPLS